MRTCFLLLLLCVTPLLMAADPADDFILPDSAAALSPTLGAALSAVSTERIRAHMAWLSDPAREGRGLGTVGLEATAEYLAREFSTLGLEPLGDQPAAMGTAAYFQRVPLRRGRGFLPGAHPSDSNWYPVSEVRRTAGPRPRVAARNLRARTQQSASVNVLAFRAGRSSSSAVVIGAHMDHLGQPGGVLHPGADDNASGMAALLEIARAISQSPAQLEHSVVFVFWTGEELGHFGSSHYVREPRWPLANTIAYLNLDMIAHLWRDHELAKLVEPLGPEAGKAFLSRVTPAYFAEPGVDRGAPWLAAHVAAAGRVTGMALHIDRVDGRNGGSDYREFARAGLPWARFFGNFFPGYHEPGDVMADIDASQVQRMAQLALATTWLVAEVSASAP